MQTITLAEFIRQHKLTMSAERWHENPYMPDGQRTMDHWRVRITARTEAGRRSFTTYFSMGFGHNGHEPTLADLLNCFASDHTEESFENWAHDLGYDADSRKAERTYRIVQQQRGKVERLLGPEAYDQLVYHTERL